LEKEAGVEVKATADGVSDLSRTRAS